MTAVEAGIAQLASVWGAAGAATPSAVALRDAFAGGSADQLKEAAQGLHYELLRLLHAADFSLGESYDLGRALAYTTLKPHDEASLREQFAFYRLQTLQGWLADLASALPAHAARSVSVSLDLWQRAIPDPGPAAAPAAPIPSKLWRILHRQGKLWREVLTGAKDGRDMLGIRDFIDAGTRLLEDAGRLIGDFFSKRRVLIGSLLVLAGLSAVVLVLVFAHQAATKLTGSLVALATTLGITWATVRSTLGKALTQAEQPLWQAELRHRDRRSHDPSA